ncbi:hypothetical protein ISX56_30145, partial [Serratia ureilytica]|nr:hypothetical protein [Serratia ureilytica]
GIVAEREEQAIAAMRRLKTEWKPWAGLPDLSPEALPAALEANPKTDRVLHLSKKKRPLLRSRLLTGQTSRITSSWLSG